MTHARGVRQTFLGDPVLTDLILIRGALSPMARRLGEQETEKAITSMIEAGLDEQTARETYSAVSELVRGSVLLARLAQKHQAAKENRSGGDDGFATAATPHDNRAFELLRCAYTSRREILAPSSRPTVRADGERAPLCHRGSASPRQQFGRPGRAAPIPRNGVLEGSGRHHRNPW
jgi:hypothetical protein